MLFFNDTANTEIDTYGHTLARHDARPILRTIAEWRGGKLRARRSPAAQTALETVLPELVRALGAAPDPQATLLRFDKLVSGLPSAVGFFHLLAAQWFNPFAWRAIRAFRFDQEAACDARVLNMVDREEADREGRSDRAASSDRKSTRLNSS